MKILVIGSCRNNDYEWKNRLWQDTAKSVAQELAYRNHSLITGGAGGLQGICADMYKQSKGKDWTAYYAEGEENDPNARPVTGRAPDNVVLTHMPFPMRNAYYTGLCDGVLAFSGRILTLGEIISASNGYGKKIFQVKMGNNIDIIGKLSELERIFISGNIASGLDFLEGKK